MKPTLSRLARVAAGTFGVILTVLTSSPVEACPFCSAVAQTLRQEMDAMDAVVIATSMQSDATRNTDSGEVKMKITSVLKGEQHVKAGQEVTAVYFGNVSSGREFLLSGVDPQDMQWSCLPLNERAKQYVAEIPRLSKLEEAERLRFYMQYLQDEDSMLSRDAYDEFASASYSAVQAIKDEMDHDQLVEWLQDDQMSPDRKRLYYTMLGVCGTKDDLPMLESLLKSTQKSTRSGLDALIACYLTLAGESGLETINELFLSNKKSSYADTYAAIMAIRFHGTEGGVIARSALFEPLHHILAREDLADLVIPDLARWQDWSPIERIRELFVEADADNNWVRVPVVNYLRACPLPRAKEILEELEKIDPKSVRRANTFFSVPKPAAEIKPSTSMISAKHATRLAWNAGTGLRPGGQLVAAIPLDAREVSARHGSHTRQANPFRSGFVVALCLVTLLLGFWLVLTGGEKAVARRRV